MRSAILTNTSTAAANAVSSPAATATASGQAAASAAPNTEKIQEDAILSKERGPSIPKKIDALFEKESLDPEAKGPATYTPKHIDLTA